MGCGPAGLLAAEAAVQAESTTEMEIFSLKKKSPIGGAQYLHTPIPRVTEEVASAMCGHIKRGTRWGYSTKVYGHPDAPTSWDSYEDGASVEIWPMIQAYDILWRRYEDCINDVQIDRTMMLALAREYDLVVSTVPLSSIAEVGCEFKSQVVWISYYRERPEMEPPVGKDFVEWNGDPRFPYYRTSFLFGWRSYEYGHEPDPFDEGVPVSAPVKIQKPLSYVGEPGLPGNVLAVGRYGAHRKAALIHDAYIETLARLRWGM